jgi:hypothetical protein
MDFRRRRIDPDWTPYLIAIGAGVAVAFLLAAVGAWMIRRADDSAPPPSHGQA